MIDSRSLVRYLDELLAVATIEDSSTNGLQVQGEEQVSRVGFAVDACLASVQEAARNNIQLLVVHHGLFWRECPLVVDLHYYRMKVLLDNGIGLYAAHLPLDWHPVLGNNRQIADLLSMDISKDFGMIEGVHLGKVAEFRKSVHRDKLKKEIDEKLDTTCQLLPFGPEQVKRVGIVSGGGTSLLLDAIEEGCDTFLTGEQDHSSYHAALESGVNVYMAGHYATETLGLRALQDHIESELSVETEFIDIPTGL